MLVAVEDHVRPDLVGDHEHVVLFEELHGALQLPALPDAATGVVGGAEDNGVDLVVHDLLLHVLKVHAPDVVLV